MSLRKYINQSLFLIFTCVSFSAFAAPSKEVVKEFVTSLSQDVIDALKNNIGNLQGRQQAFEDIFRKAGDVPKIARFVAASAWRNSNDKDKEEYVETYRHYMAFTYATRIKEYNEQQIVIQRISDTSQRNISVNTALTSKNSNNRMSVIWQLLSNNDTLKVTDLKIENISMALTQRAEFTIFLQAHNNDLSQLTDFLKQRLQNS